jgi:hypothetical protein
MMAKQHPTLQNQVFETRYERGYRYLDRCGDVMLVLEDLLGSETGTTWMTEDLVPTGAKIKSPDLELQVQFDSQHLVVEQHTPPDPSHFDAVCELVLATIIGRLDLRTFTWIGFRQWWWAGADSIEHANQLSLKALPLDDWGLPVPQGMVRTAYEATATCENEDGSLGYRVAVAPAHKIGAVIRLDDRLKRSPRTLPTGQREALLAQLKRYREREENPEAGLQIDIDFYAANPPKPEAKALFENAANLRPKIIEASLGKGVLK